jgi:hypothetical protein
MTNITFSPNRNAQFHFTEAFKVIDNALDIYFKLVKDEIKKWTDQLSGFWRNLFGGRGAQDATSVLNDLEGLIDKRNDTIIEDPLVKRMILEAGQKYGELSNVSMIQSLKAFSKDISQKLTQEEISKFEYSPQPDPFQNALNRSQLLCHKYIVKALQLQENPKIKSAIWSHFAHKSQYLSKIIDGFRSRLLFTTKYVMKSVLIYLVLTL